MKTIENVHCFFEQSGTFKNQFRQLGVNALDYDIRNDFGQTDVQADLFAEIANAYESKPSLFGRIGKDDLILAFFPCIRFEAQAQLWFSGQNFAQRAWTDEQKLLKSMQMHEELHALYMTLCRLFVICLRGGVQTHCRESMYAPALSHGILPDKAKGYRQRQDGKR